MDAELELKIPAYILVLRVLNLTTFGSVKSRFCYVISRHLCIPPKKGEIVSKDRFYSLGFTEVRWRSTPVLTIDKISHKYEIRHDRAYNINERRPMKSSVYWIVDSMLDITSARVGNRAKGRRVQGKRGVFEGPGWGCGGVLGHFGQARSGRNIPASFILQY